LPLGAYTTFRGQAVDDTAVLIAYTRTGDANLDGIVNDDDVTIVGATYAPGVGAPHWALGDFDFSGFVDDDDVTLLGAFYNPAAGAVAPPALVRGNDLRSSWVNELFALVTQSAANGQSHPVSLELSAPSARRRTQVMDVVWAEWETSHL
jgi:hypothetical protein